ncbi:TPA: TolC family protein [Candidatus Poribacteria bacterium]|nr:TolC family protein [Candidatus Poribacteria bacterium]
MMTKITCIILITITIICFSLTCYSIDLPYISFGERKNESQMRTDEKNTDRKSFESNKPSIDLSKPLTLKQCINIALKESPTMKVANIDLTEQEMSIQDAKSNYYPEVGVSGRYMFSDKIDFGWEKENYYSSLDASYLIWDHGQRKSTLKQAEARKQAEYSRYQRTAQSLIFNVIRAYYGLLEAEKIISVDEQVLDISKHNVEKVQAFVEKGLSIEADLATARVQQANNELTLINDLNSLNIARANLAVILGLDPETQIQVIDDPDYEVYVKTGLIETEEILAEDMKAQSMKSRPELAELNANMTVLELAAELAKLERWPKLYADTHYGIALSDYLRERESINKYRTWDVMARLTYPLYDAGRSKRMVQKAELALKKIDENKTELEQSIALEVRQAYLDFERAKKSLEISAVQVEDAKMSLEVTQGRYDLNDATLIELLDIQSRYARALTNRVRAFYDYKIARRALEKAMGILQ